MREEGPWVISWGYGGAQAIWWVRPSVLNFPALWETGRQQNIRMRPGTQLASTPKSALNFRTAPEDRSRRRTLVRIDGLHTAHIADMDGAGRAPREGGDHARHRTTRLHEGRGDRCARLHGGRHRGDAHAASGAGAGRSFADADRRRGGNARGLG